METITIQQIREIMRKSRSGTNRQVYLPKAVYSPESISTAEQFYGKLENYKVEQVTGAKNGLVINW